MITVADLLTAGRLEPVPADPATATARLARADEHLQTASLVGQDNEVAYGSLYDAARKAITAHMLANGSGGNVPRSACCRRGLRPRTRPRRDGVKNIVAAVRASL